MHRHLGEFEQLLLFALLEAREETDGAAIRQSIEARTGRLGSPGAIYTAMDRLGSRGFVSAEVRTTTPAEGGRRRKYYRLEREGARALQRSFRTLTLMAEGLGTRLAEVAGDPRGGRS